jgi:hypothetical protein
LPAKANQKTAMTSEVFPFPAWLRETGKIFRIILKLRPALPLESWDYNAGTFTVALLSIISNSTAQKQTNDQRNSSSKDNKVTTETTTTKPSGAIETSRITRKLDFQVALLRF